MIPIVATLKDEAHADRLIKVLTKVGATEIRKIRKKDAFTVKFTAPKKAPKKSANSKESAAKPKKPAVKSKKPAKPKKLNHIHRYLLSAGSEGRIALNKILRDPSLNSSQRVLDLLLDASPKATALRARVIAIARATIPDFPGSDS